MPKLYMLIGVPGAGKSTWVANQNFDMTKTTVVSSDKFIDEHAAKEGKTYNEVFDSYVKIATKLMENHALIAKANGLDVVWDQTNMSAKSRAKKLAMLDGYEKIAVVFATPEADELKRRLDSRPGKHISASVMNSMINSYVEPTEEEGFKEILYV